MNRYFERLWRALSQPRREWEAGTLERMRPPLPVIWLLGKTGAGKSSLIRALTGLDEVEIGNGFAPCTRTADMFDFPEELPVLRFLDTRGLGEAGYDPTEDLDACEKRSHVLLAVARLDDPVQGELAAAMDMVSRRRPKTPIIVVHNGADLLPDEQTRFRALEQTRRTLEKAAGRKLPYVETRLGPGAASDAETGIDALVTQLDHVIPEVALLLAREERRGLERGAFSAMRARVLWYAGAAGASDVAPVVGAVTVPAIQADMLRALARHYGVEWTRSRMTEFAVALGTGAAARYGASYAIRQLTKLIPVYGQTAGAAAAGTISFAATYALGRAAAFYLHRTQQGLSIDTDELRALYTDALRRARREKR